ncbi:MAG: DUF3471 domain-containing protein [Chitinophagaceae bacterium]
MKKYLFVSIALLFYATAPAQLENTRWKTTLTIDEKALNVIIDFKKDTVVLYTTADSILIEKMTYTKTNALFTLLKIEGQSDCDNGTPGEYAFTIKGDSLLLKLLKDDCYDRYSVLQHTKWKKWKSYPGIKVDEAILKQYTGVYAHDEAHPITISLQNGILYAEGPNNGLPKSPFTPITASKFFLGIAGVEMDFIKDANGQVFKLISHEEKDFELKKIK